MWASHHVKHFETNIQKLRLDKKQGLRCKKRIHLNLATASGRLRLTDAKGYAHPVRLVIRPAPVPSLPKSWKSCRTTSPRKCKRVDIFPNVLTIFDIKMLNLSCHSMTLMTVGFLAPSPRKCHDKWVRSRCPVSFLRPGTFGPAMERSAECWRIPINTASGLEVARFRSLKIYQCTSNTYAHTVAYYSTLFNYF